MATYSEFVDRYGDDYDTEAERRAGFQRHEQNRRELEDIFHAAFLEKDNR